MQYPALDVRGADAGLVLAVVDDCAPTAVEDLADGIAIYFATASQRDAALAAVTAALPAATVAAREVDDEDWARRSQQGLTPITVGRITVTPPWYPADPREPSAAGHVTITILPSMGFGTGHHATTRLCLAALQTIKVSGRTVLDVGTGSGVLAIAAAALGAAEALGIDFDADAVQSADENLGLNPGVHGVRFALADIRAATLPTADIVFANLTGAVLVQNASLLGGALAAGGTLIVSGLQSHERDEVLAAFDTLRLAWSAEEAGWVGLAFTPVP